jgi:short/branched chain acyl-CoA dehydrogenase
MSFLGGCFRKAAVSSSRVGTSLSATASVYHRQKRSLASSSRRVNNTLTKHRWTSSSLSSSSSKSVSSLAIDDDNDGDSSSSISPRMSPVTTFTEDEEMTRTSVRSWAREVLLPKVRSMDDEGRIDPIVIQNLFEQGYMGMEIPDLYGGSGLSFTAACLTVEEISRVDPSVAIMVDIHNTLTNNAVRFWGSTTLQEKWLPRLATDCVSSFCLSEAGSGSDAFAMKMTADKSADGTYYTLNGNKLWISSAKEAGLFLVFANAQPSLGYKGITGFLVDARTEGVSVGSPERKLGLKASSTCPLMFDNVKVSVSDVLGEVGMGYKYCINILNEGRIGIAAQQIGIAKGCMDIAIPYMIERKQFGQAIVDFQVSIDAYVPIYTTFLLPKMVMVIPFRAVF